MATRRSKRRGRPAGKLERGADAGGHAANASSPKAQHAVAQPGPDEDAERALRWLRDLGRHGKTSPASMRAIPYEPKQHFEQVLQWLRMRGESTSPDRLPKTGYVVPGIAAGFLYRTDSSIAWIDSLVASKERTREERSEALDAIVQALRDEARRSGFSSLLGYTLYPVVVDRALRLGWEYVRGGYHLVVVEP